MRIIDWMIVSAWRAIVLPFAVFAVTAWSLGVPPHIAMVIGSAVVAALWATVNHLIR